MAATMLGSLLVSLGLESGEFKTGLAASQKELRSAQRNFEQIGRKMQMVGAGLTASISAPVVALAATAVKGAQEQAAAMGQVEAALASMGKVSGKTASQLAKAADALEMRSLFNADVILTKVTANLLTFGNVANEQFDRAQQAAIDMATRMGSDPQSAAIMLGKALNDPIKGITALTRVGVQFTEAQKAQIKAFTETGQTAKAQGVILNEVERQFRGAAAAAADTQPWRKAQVAIDQAMDKIGEAILPIIPVIADAIKAVASAFTELTPGMQKAIIIIGGVAAALGPLLIVFGTVTSAMAPFLATIKLIGASGGIMVAAKAAIAGLTTAFWPLAAAAGAVYLAWKNWDTIAPILVDLGQQFRALGEGLGLVEANANASAAELEKFRAMRTVGEDLRSFADGADELNQSLRDMNKAAADAGTATREALQSAWQAFEGWWNRTQANANALVAMFVALPGKVIESLRRLVSGVQEWMGNKLTAAFEGAKKKIQEVGGWFYDLYDKVVGNSYVPDMVDEIGQNMRRLETEMVAPTKSATKKTADVFRELQAEVSGILARLFPEIEKAMTLEREMKALEAYHRAGKSTAEQHAAAVEALKREYAGLHRDVAGAEAGGGLEQIASTTDGKTIAQMSEEVGARFSEVMARVRHDGNVAKVQVVQSFKDMADGALAAFDRMANAIKGGGFLNILQSVVGFGLQLGSIGAFGKTIQANINAPQARAMGGPVMAGKPYLVGEVGPEIVVPGASGSVISNRDLLGMGGGGIAQIVPSPYFDVVVDGRVMRAAPGIASAGASGGLAQMRRSGQRRVA